MIQNFMKMRLNQEKIEYIYSDVRDEIPDIFYKQKYDLAANFAAVHREPGHDHEEYFHTNIKGAENICKFAEKAGCRKIIFTSSIAVYNPTVKFKSEGELPAPVSSYGSSKLAAEKIHLAWKSRGSDRILVILRPGVVYGPGEGGNVSRMIKSMLKGYFVFTGNKRTAKASIYVKELCRIMEYSSEKAEDDKNRYVLLNAVWPESPDLESYTAAIKKAFGFNKTVPDIPWMLVYICSFFISAAFGLAGKRTEINPARVKKYLYQTV